MIHSYRHRLGLAPGYPPYEEIQPIIAVPAITLDGVADGNYPASDGSVTAAKFRGPRTHHRVPDADHNPASGKLQERLRTQSWSCWFA